MQEPRFSQPLEAQVNTRRWTTKVNAAIIVAVALLFLGGVAYGVFAIMHTSEVQQDVHDEVAPQPAR